MLRQKAKLKRKKDAVFSILFSCLFSTGGLYYTRTKKGSDIMSEIFEIIMILSFGASWPMNVMKSYKARTTRGKSLGFLLLIFFGYIMGIISKLLNEAYMADFASKWYVLFFYVLNLCMVGVDLLLYVRNRKLDKINGII